MLIFRDDDQNDTGSKFIVKADIDIKALITMLKKYYEIEEESMRRIRDLSNQRLFTKEDLTVTLKEIRSKGEKGECLVLERIRLERGPIPDRGGFSCKVKLDLVAENGEKIKLTEEFILYLYNTVEEVFTRACSRLNVLPAEYSLYLCNWAEEPTKKLKNLGSTLEQEGILETTIFKLMHNTQGLSDEIRSYEIYYSASGMPDDLKIIGKLSVNENQTMKDLKKAIKDLCNKENGFETEFVGSMFSVGTRAHDGQKNEQSYETIQSSL